MLIDNSRATKAIVKSSKNMAGKNLRSKLFQTTVDGKATKVSRTLIVNVTEQKVSTQRTFVRRA